MSNSDIMITELDGSQRRMRDDERFVVDLPEAFVAARANSAAALLTSEELASIEGRIRKWLENGEMTTLSGLLRSLDADIAAERRVFAMPFLQVLGREAVARWRVTAS